MNQLKITYSAGGVVANGKGGVVLIYEDGNFWGLPKGRIDKDESALAAAIREIKEEAGIDELQLLAPLGTYERHPYINNVEDKNELKVIQMFLFKSEQTEMHPKETNSEPAWLPIEEAVQKLTHPADRGFFVSVEDRIKSV